MQVDVRYHFRKNKMSKILIVEEEMEKLELSYVARTKTLMSNLAISSTAEEAHSYGSEFYFWTQ